jgi:hypothetical protein
MNAGFASQQPIFFHTLLEWLKLVEFVCMAMVLGSVEDE